MQSLSVKDHLRWARVVVVLLSDVSVKDQEFYFFDIEVQLSYVYLVMLL